MSVGTLARSGSSANTLFSLLSQYKKAHVEKPWAYMFAYYCDEDKARLSGGIGYIGHHGGGDLEMISYHEYVANVVYPYVLCLQLLCVAFLLMRSRSVLVLAIRIICRLPRYLLSRLCSWTY